MIRNEDHSRAIFVSLASALSPDSCSLFGKKKEEPVSKSDAGKTVTVEGMEMPRGSILPSQKPLLRRNLLLRPAALPKTEKEIKVASAPTNPSTVALPAFFPIRL